MPDRSGSSGPSDSPANSQLPPPSPAALQIIWIALLVSIGMYAVVGNVIKPNVMAATMPADQLSFITMVLTGVAVVVSGMAMMAPRVLGKMPVASLHIVRWGLAESIGMFGLILRFMGANNTWFYGFIAWSALLLVTLRPNQDEQR